MSNDALELFRIVRRLLLVICGCCLLALLWWVVEETILQRQYDEQMAAATYLQKTAYQQPFPARRYITGYIDLGRLLVISLASVFLFAIVWSLPNPREMQKKHRLRCQQTGVCIACGYDVRFINSHRCPECGTRIVRPKSAASTIAIASALQGSSLPKRSSPPESQPQLKLRA